MSQNATVKIEWLYDKVDPRYEDDQRCSEECRFFVDGGSNDECKTNWAKRIDPISGKPQALRPDSDKCPGPGTYELVKVNRN